MFEKMLQAGVTKGKAYIAKLGTNFVCPECPKLKEQLTQAQATIKDLQGKNDKLRDQLIALLSK